MLISLLFGLWRGLFYEVLSLLGWPIAFVLSNSYAQDFAQYLPVEQEMLRSAGAYVLVFIAVLLVWAMLAWGLSKLLKAIGLGYADRMLGGLFGVLRGLLVVLVGVWLAGVTNLPERPFWRDAHMSKPAEDVALLAKVWLPENIAQRIRYRSRH